MTGLLADIYLRYRLRALKRDRSEQPPSWENVQSVALILANSPQFNKSAIDAFIKQTGKYVEVFFVQPRQKQALFADWRCFTQSDLGRGRLPRAALLTELQKTRFDVVINAAPGNRFAVLLSAAIPSGLHSSPAVRYSESDLIITWPHGQGLVGYLELVTTYLRQIRVKK